MSHYNSKRPEDIPPKAWRKTSLGAFDELHRQGHEVLHAAAHAWPFKYLFAADSEFRRKQSDPPQQS